MVVYLNQHALGDAESYTLKGVQVQRACATEVTDCIAIHRRLDDPSVLKVQPL